MTWVRLDDRVMSHPKVLRAGVDAFALWVAGLAWCNLHQTDGRIPFECIGELLPSGWRVAGARLSRARERLETLSMWTRTDDGIEVYGYRDHQKAALREEVEARQADAAERKKRQRSRENGTRHAVTSSTTSQRDTSAASQRDADPLSQPPGPARPGPTRPSHSASERADAGATPASARAKPRSQEVRELVRERYRAAGQTLPRQATDLTGIEGTRFREWAEQVDDLPALAAQLDAFLRAKPLRPFGWFMTNPAEALTSQPMHDTPEMRAAAVAALAKVPTITVPKGSEDEPLPANFMEGVTWR